MQGTSPPVNHALAEAAEKVMNDIVGKLGSHAVGPFGQLTNAQINTDLDAVFNLMGNHVVHSYTGGNLTDPATLQALNHALGAIDTTALQGGGIDHAAQIELVGVANTDIGHGYFVV